MIKEFHRDGRRVWPGPFVARTDFPNLTRPAVYLQCPGCGKLFVRASTWIRTKRGVNAVCSIGCGRRIQPKKVYLKQCPICRKKFTVSSAQRKVRYCSLKCARIPAGVARTRTANRPTTLYLASRGFDEVTCDYCGRSQYYIGATRHRGVYVTHLDGNVHNNQAGNLAAICKNCKYKQLRGSLGPRLPVKERFV